MASKMTVPPSGVRFRILSTSINEMLGGHTGEVPANPGVNIDLPYSTSKNDYSYYDDTWFTLKPSDKPGYYLIHHFTTGRWIYGSLEREEVGLTGVGGYDDQLWSIDFKEGNEFQLKNCSSGKLFLRNHASPHLGITPSDVFDYGDQFFRFFFEEMTIKSIKFDLNQGRILSKTPKLLAKQTFSNHSSLQQEQKFTVTYTQTKQHRWAYTGGFTITASMEMSFKAGVPVFAESEYKFSLGIETDHHWTTETVTTETKQMQVEFPVSVPPGKTVTASAMITEDKGEVPYEATLCFKGSEVEAKSFGKWVGVQSVNVFNEIQEE